jgi:hypothetical protein
MKTVCVCMHTSCSGCCCRTAVAEAQAHGIAHCCGAGSSTAVSTISKLLCLFLTTLRYSLLFDALLHTAYDCLEDCALYALDAGVLLVAGYQLNSIQVSYLP